MKTSQLSSDQSSSAASQLSLEEVCSEALQFLLSRARRKTVVYRQKTLWNEDHRQINKPFHFFLFQEPCSFPGVSGRGSSVHCFSQEFPSLVQNTCGPAVIHTHSGTSPQSYLGAKCYVLRRHTNSRITHLTT